MATERECDGEFVPVRNVRCLQRSHKVKIETWEFVRRVVEGSKLALTILKTVILYVHSYNAVEYMSVGG